MPTGTEVLVTGHVTGHAGNYERGQRCETAMVRGDKGQRNRCRSVRHRNRSRQHTATRQPLLDRFAGEPDMTVFGALSELRLAAHRARWAVLPLVTVPSAAITDAQIEQWSREEYAHDLAGLLPEDEAAQ